MAVVKRLLLLFTGWLSIILGVIGIFLPLLPTTPFLLLALWCFARSSDTLHQWLLDHKTLGPILQDWEEKQGVSRSVRNKAIVVLWCGLTLSMVVIAQAWAIVLLSTIGLCVSFFLFSRTLPE